MFKFSPTSSSVSIMTSVVIVMATTIARGNLIRDATGDSLKCSHVTLISALSGHSLEYLSSSPGGTDGSNVEKRRGESDSSKRGGNAKKSSENNSAVPIESGGEVLALKSFPLSPQEPTCQQLHAMWIFSKRQSRASEMTNEVPTHRDPFAFNVWEPFYSSTRSLGAVRLVPRYIERSSLPVFGRIVSREPLLPQGVAVGHRQRYPSETVGSTRSYSVEAKPTSSAFSAVMRRPSQYRSVGASGSNPNGALSGSLRQNFLTVQGSFQKLKELIWTERAKELTQQRRVEELAARAAVLKEIANGQNFQALYKQSHKSESPLTDENRTPKSDEGQHINDSSISIAGGQPDLDMINNKNSKSFKTFGKPPVASLTRRFTSRGVQVHNFHTKPIFSGNPPINLPSGSSTFSLHPELTASDSYKHDKGLSIINIEMSNTSALRPSHFRKRNRWLFKKNLPTDYFQRIVRRDNHHNIESATKSIALEHSLSNINSLLQYNRTANNFFKSPSLNRMPYFAPSDRRAAGVENFPVIAREHHETDDLNNEKKQFPQIISRDPYWATARCWMSQVATHPELFFCREKLRTVGQTLHHHELLDNAFKTSICFLKGKLV